MNIQNIDINNLEISSLNVRELYDDNSLTELVNNINEHGLLNPLTVKFNNITNKYNIIAGLRRFYAIQKLEYKNVQCNIINNDTNEKELIILSLTENIHRENMLLSDRVKTYKKLEKFYENNKELSNAINVDIKIINQCLKISHFPDSVLNKLDSKGNDRITLDFAVHLTKIKIHDEEELNKIIDLFHDVNLTTRNKLLIKIINTIKYNNIEFYEYIEQIGNIKTEYLEELKINKEKSLRINRISVDINNQIEEIQKSKIEINIQEVSEKSNTYIDLVDYDTKINKIIDKNNGVYIDIKSRNPELQQLYRNAIINRFDKCIISDMDKEVCEAAHIIPFSESNNFDIDNGLLLNSILHKLFDKYYWSINPTTLCVVIFKLQINNENIYNILKPYENKCIDIIKPYSNIIENITKHYYIAVNQK
jgi:ParB family chromosome partitioning protein